MFVVFVLFGFGFSYCFYIWLDVGLVDACLVLYICFVLGFNCLLAMVVAHVLSSGFCFA